MAELLIALAPLLVLGGIALVAMFVPLAWLVSFSLSLMVMGFAFGVPSGVYYHVLLRRALMRDGPAPRGWYWHPQRYHEQVGEQMVRTMRPWFLVGAAGFVLIIAGFLLAVLALVLWFRAGSGMLP